MQNSSKSVKSRGVLVFAINSKTVDYVAIADNTSRLISHNLQLPVTLVTDDAGNPKFPYDSIIRISSSGGTYRHDSKKNIIEWKNFDRYLAEELSPYNETILLDTDYLVLDDSLLKLFDTEFDYKLMHYNNTADGVSYSEMGVTSLPFVWATVVLFRKTQRAKLFFNLVGRIQRNYDYYRSLYNVREGNYRNDYAFAIANCILSGYTVTDTQGIPWPMFTVEKAIEKIVVSKNFVKVCHADDAIVIPYSNIHVMDKKYLQSSDFAQLVKAICEPI